MSSHWTPTDSAPVERAEAGSQESGTCTLEIPRPVDDVDAAPSEDAHATPEPQRRQRYDRGFERAVAEGHLTVEQAVARGSRRAYVAALQRRNGLPLSLALQVADNRLRLYEALGRSDRELALAHLTQRAREFGRRRLLALVLVFVSAVYVVGHYGKERWERQTEVGREMERAWLTATAMPAAKRNVPHSRSAVTEPTSTVKTERNPAGYVTRVSAGSPSAVIDALCRAFSLSGSCRRSEVRDTEPRYPGRRIGSFVAEENGIYMVHIRRDRSSGRWLVGTGLQPVTPFPDTGRSSFAPPPRATGGTERDAATF
jgi:hypothetical protein